jgi:hypothetical protein
MEAPALPQIKKRKKEFWKWALPLQGSVFLVKGIFPVDPDERNFFPRTGVTPFPPPGDPSTMRGGRRMVEGQDIALRSRHKRFLPIGIITT